MESSAPSSTLAPDSSGGGLLHALSGCALAKVLRILGGGVWRACVDPFEIVEWSWGALPVNDLAARGSLVAHPRWESIIYPPDLPVFQRAVAGFVDDALAAAPVDYRIIVRDGEFLWLRQWLLEQEDGAGRPIVTGLVKVISEEKRLQWEVMRTSEAERSRIGQEIHDDVCQILAGINYLTHVLHQRLKPDRPAEAEELERINQEIQAGLERTRALAHGLLPAKSDFNNLSQALRDLSRQVAARFGMQLTVKLPAKSPAFSREHLLHLYRIVQEASSNAFKHGRATQLEVSLSRDAQGYVLTIVDNGPGLPAESTHVEGVGLNVMRNRAELLGGRIEFANCPRGGAQVQLHLPQTL